MANLNAGNFGVGDPLGEKGLHDQLGPEYMLAEKSTRNTSLQEYIYWAEKKRAREDADTGSSEARGLVHAFNVLFNKTSGVEATEDSDKEATDEVLYDESEDFIGLTDRQAELANARRALRVAGWSTIFFLITCDILGPFNAPYAISSIGLAPGITLYILFGAVAGMTGWMLSLLFCRLDSVRFPVKTFGDLAERVLGVWARHACSILQSIQLVLNVGIICLSNGQSLSQITHGPNGGAGLCFAVCIVVWALAGMFIGQIRSLQNFGVLANASVWINLLIIILSMAFIANSPPNFAAALATYGIEEGPVIVSATVTQPVFAQVNGVFNMVFVYGGSMIFPEMMAEMRRPRDFIKGMAMAQGFIFVAYLTYGIFVYEFQGQYTLPIAYQGVSKYSFQTVGNVLALMSGIIAAGLYGNIGLKVFYINIVEDLFNGPTMMSKKGRVLWSILIVIYWALAFVIGSAIPAIGALSGLIAAMAIFQFSYTFPPLLMLAFDIGLDASLGDEPFTTPGVNPVQIDTWKQASRWKRGVFGGGSKRVAIKFGNFFFFLAALATAGLGLWATGTDLVAAISAGAATSFGCASPV